MKQLSPAELREMAGSLHLELDEGEVERLRPMVQDLLDVAQRLRRDYAPRIDSATRRPG